MSEVPQPLESAPTDVGEYCRRVEDHLTRVNAGHLVRIVGPGFELVRQWAESGIPLSVVFRGIELKAERHSQGASKRPLRIEFCAGDVQAVFDHWRRAVGLMGVAEADDRGLPGAAESDEQASAPAKRPSLSRHLDRAIERLSRAIARVDLPDGLRADCTQILQALATLRETSARLRGSAREEAEAALAQLDAELTGAARRHAPADWLRALRTEAAGDLAPFRSRLAPDAWEHSMNVTVDRLLKDRLGLPVLDL